MYYFEAFGYLQEYNGTPSKNLMNKAIAGFDKVIKEFPTGQYADSAIKTKASCYEMLGQFDKAVSTREILLSKPYVDKLNRNEQFAIVKKIATSLYNQRQWKAGKKWFERMLNTAVLPEDKVFAASGLIQAACAQKDYETVKKYFPYLVIDAPARSDIALNYALLLAGDDLVKKEKFSEASVFYNMVLSRDTIVNNLKRFLEKAQKQLERAQRVSGGQPRRSGTYRAGCDPRSVHRGNGARRRLYCRPHGAQRPQLHAYRARLRKLLVVLADAQNIPQPPEH